MPGENSREPLFDDARRAVYDKGMEARLTRIETCPKYSICITG